MVELLPCPFCGCDTAHKINQMKHFYSVECLNCGAMTALGSDKAAIRLWNRRAERTCKVDSCITDNWEYQTWDFGLTCGHTATMTYKEPPNYCPECGARVEKVER